MTDEQIRNILIDLNNKFTQYETTNPQKGYCVKIEVTPVIDAKLFLMEEEDLRNYYQVCQIMN